MTRILFTLGIHITNILVYIALAQYVVGNDATDMAIRSGIVMLGLIWMTGASAILEACGVRKNMIRPVERLVDQWCERFSQWRERRTKRKPETEPEIHTVDIFASVLASHIIRHRNKLSRVRPRDWRWSNDKFTVYYSEGSKQITQVKLSDGGQMREFSPLIGSTTLFEAMSQAVSLTLQDEAASEQLRIDMIALDGVETLLTSEP